MTYKVKLANDVYQDIRLLDKKTISIIKKNLRKLKDDPYPGRGSGNKEKLPIDGKERYRMHIGHTWTVFYSILEDKKEVRISEILTINEAHERYGFRN
ncbi:MAG: type II toxin-antitoxin system RelE/ParE family toxin [Candidatus Thermoplasmatota archaeon]|nr:type II toxin-antitoxin system RelE/ParE family toxin [Candidatus Thermoplasmatota archaeon]